MLSINSMLKILTITLLMLVITPVDYEYTKVSWYGNQFHGRKTASGEIFNENELVAASKELPFNTLVEITNLRNNKTIVVRINDRGPYVDNRDFDLSKAAFDSIGNLDRGVMNVKYIILTK